MHEVLRLQSAFSSLILTSFPWGDTVVHFTRVSVNSPKGSSSVDDQNVYNIATLRVAIRKLQGTRLRT